MTDISKLSQEIADAEEKLNALKAQKKELEGLEPAQYLATVLHSRLCTWNHTDGCSWFYAVKNGKHDWTEFNHKFYLERAENVLRFCEKQDISVNNALALFSIMTER